MHRRTATSLDDLLSSTLPFVFFWFSDLLSVTFVNASEGLRLSQLLKHQEGCSVLRAAFLVSGLWGFEGFEDALRKLRFELLGHEQVRHPTLM